MGIQAKVTVTPNPNLLNQMKLISGQHIIEIGEVMVAYAQRDSPFKKGHNRRSIRLEPPSPQPQALAVSIVTESGYGGYLELGTERMEARPYIAPNYEPAKEAVHNANA